MTQNRQILKSASVVTLITLTSRICGYWRDQRITALLGTSRVADALILAFRIPNLFRRLVSEGSFSAAFIPVFSRYLRQPDKTSAWTFACRAFWTLALVAGGIAAAGVLASRWLINAFTLPGSSSAGWGQAVFLNRIIFPYVFFLALAALAMAILNSLDRFAVPAATTIVFNLTVIAFTVTALYRPIMNRVPAGFRSPAVAIGVGILLGGILQFAMQVPALLRQGMNFRFDISFRDPGIQRVGKIMVPGFFAVGIFQVNFFVDTIFATASRMPQGSIMSLYVADRVVELVLGSYAIAIATVSLPLLSRQAVAGKYEEMKKTFAFALRIVSFITIPAAVGLVLMRGPIIQVLFEHGKFAAESAALTSRALLFYALGLPAFAGVKLVVPLFYSAHDTRTPVRIAAWALGLNVIFNLVFLEFFFQMFSNGSPALATSLAAYFNFLALLWIFRERYGALGLREVASSMVKSVVSTLGMGAACVLFLHYAHFELLDHLIAKIEFLILGIGCAIAIYLGVAWLLRCPELSELRGVMRHADVQAS